MRQVEYPIPKGISQNQVIQYSNKKFVLNLPTSKTQHTIRRKKIHFLPSINIEQHTRQRKEKDFFYFIYK